MRSLPPLAASPEIEAIARRVVWFESFEQAVAQPARFLAYVMTYGTFDDIATLQRHWSDDDLLAGMDAAPPGIFDGRSWAYWNAKLGRYPIPPEPKRMFGAE